MPHDLLCLRCESVPSLLAPRRRATKWPLHRNPPPHISRPVSRHPTSSKTFGLLSGKSAFAPELVKVVANPSIPRSEAALSILEQPDGSYKFGFLGEHWGQPKRRALPEAFMLLANHYARLVINARHTSYSGQHYSETIYNVTCGQNVASDRFFREKPDYELDLRAHLF